MASHLLHERLRAPAWSHRNVGDNTTHVSYELPHRLYRAAQYPVLSPNGSSIFVYAHQDGLTVVWRGGRRFKPDAGQDVQDASDAMIVESDDQTRDTRFEGYRDDLDATQAVESVVATVGISLGVSVFDLSFPPLPTDLAGHSMRSVPAFFSHTIAVTVICGDDTTRLVTLPLSPPASALDVDLSEEAESPEFQCFIVPAPSVAHKERPRGVSVTYASSTSLNDEDGFEDQATDAAEQEWDLVIAVHSASPQPLLTICHLPLLSSSSITPLFEPDKTESRAIYLPHPLSSIAFNPERSPSFRSTRLLLADASGAVRLARVQRPSEDGFNTGLQWLGSLQAPFPRQGPSNNSSLSQRDRVLDAKWALGGKAVAAVLASGQWGIWDLEGAGPTRHDSIDGTRLRNVHGGGVTNFTIRGVIGPSPEESAGFPSRLKMRSHTPASNQDSSRLAPMTPKTRKAKQDRLFSNDVSSTRKATSVAQHSSGGLSIVPTHTFDHESRVSDESLVMWFGTSVYVVPSIIQHWHRALTSPSLDNGEGMSVLNSPGAQSVPVPQMALGETILSISQLSNQGGSGNPAASLTHDIVIALEHRVTIICAERRQRKTAGELRDLFQQPEQAKTNQLQDQSKQRDLDMLHQGQLDLGGLDRMMDEMTEQEPSVAELSQPRSRRVGFAS